MHRKEFFTFCVKVINRLKTLGWSYAIFNKEKAAIAPDLILLLFLDT